MTYVYGFVYVEKKNRKLVCHYRTDHQNLTAASSPGVQHIAKSVESEASRHSSDSWPLQLKVVDSKRDPTGAYSQLLCTSAALPGLAKYRRSSFIVDM